jgi:hypothetical protein
LIDNEFVIRLKKADDGMFIFSHEMELIEQLFKAAMGISNFNAPIVCEVLCVFLSPAAPLVLVGFSGFILLPIYEYGVRKYE